MRLVNMLEKNKFTFLKLRILNLTSKVNTLIVLILKIKKFLHKFKKVFWLPQKIKRIF